MRFWLDRGVDGFRVDVLWHLIKDDLWRDNPPNPGFRPGMSPYDRLLPVYTADRPEVLGVVAGLRRVLDGYDQRVLIGEIYLPIERLVTYYGEDLSGAHLPFNFQLILAAWDPQEIASLIREYEAALPSGGWPNWVLGNHDNHRIASRIGPAQARVAAMLLLTLRGTPTMYYGDELGMVDVPIPPELVQDPFEKNVPGIGVGRDPERTPMPWNAGPNGGFTIATPWLPLGDDIAHVNVLSERDDPTSILSLHRALIALRQSDPALTLGSIGQVEAQGAVLTYRRESDGRRLLVALNFTSDPATVSVPPGRILLSTHLDRGGSVHGLLALRGDEGAIVELA
jgi:alpha-glucosidase